MNRPSILLASHDAGGAEILAAWAEANPGNDYRYFLDGPAVAIFSRRFGVLENLFPAGPAGLDTALNLRRPDRIVTSTSWASDMERRVRALGAGRGIPTAACLDHWVNYRERFGYPGPWMDSLPDEIWCPDPECRDLCLGLGFPRDRLVLVGNPYLEGLRRQMSALGAPEEKGLALYVCEPIREHMFKAHGDPLHLGYDEFDALRGFFGAVRRWRSPPTRFLIRPHPSEDPAKYLGLAEGYGESVRIEFSRGTSLLQDIARAELVAGCESMAMAVALAAGKRVVTAVPPYAKQPCRLPQAGILSLAAAGI